MMTGSGHALICHPAMPALAVRAIAVRVTGVDAHWLTLRWRIEGAGRVIVPAFAGRVRRDGLWQATCFELFARGHGGGGRGWGGDMEQGGGALRQAQGERGGAGGAGSGAGGAGSAANGAGSAADGDGGHGAGGGYCEVNLSPSEAWAVYRFAGYRGAAEKPDVPVAPVGTWRRPAHSDIAVFDAAIPVGVLPALPFAAGVAAVIAEDDGGAVRLSYWALAHHAARPDFHDLATFILTISRAEAL